MAPILVSVAFLLGFLVRQVGLPPLVGFLAAGFMLNALGFESSETLQHFADLGVTLLLFSIGLKLDLKSLAKPEVWAGASLHMAITVIVFGLGIFGLGLTGLPFFSELSLPLAILVAFALSFSSTVFAVKILEEKGEMGAMHGRVSIGILIMQDIYAVLFLTFSLGKLPTFWALLIPLALLALKPLLYRLMTRSGHGELLLLFGLCAALVVGAGGFELVGLKADLGALILGILLAGHAKSSELAKTLMSLKDLLLVGFFLTIGLSGTPSLAAVGVASLLVAAMPLKVFLFYLLLTRFKLRARSSLLGSLSLANYSEFGLIVAAVGASQGWIGSEWLVIIALALSATFVVASPLNTAADALYIRYRDRLCRWETDSRHSTDQPIDPADATIAVFGMGRVGSQVYDYMCEKYGETVLGFDFNAEKVQRHCEQGRNVVFGDPTDPDFWSRIKPGRGEARMAVLTMPKYQANLAAARHLVEIGFPGQIAAIAHFDDQVEELRNTGVGAAFNFYNQAGFGFAEHVWERLEGKVQNAVQL
ncbi:MAG: cation:proton antiporter [Desulfuromonadales bacterium]|nr:cation:proton antiporter [Desulfuromonadales bacterium]